MVKQRPRINVKPEDSDGTYSNLVLVAFSRAEFVLDFARIMPGASAASLKSRVIMSPHAAKAFAEQLSKQVETYESKNGTLADSREQNSIGFNTPGNED
ncbi:MAG: DUF3467 domain-containing protein [Candidatus Fermentibacteria bacterium]|nr:DUF3467 domain-containing protein [Candidatus Sabulitectum sp.]MEA3265973.1 DUF3467 domain-containing protein [Candidatus Fermentibacteria bacterium]